MTAQPPKPSNLSRLSAKVYLYLSRYALLHSGLQGLFADTRLYAACAGGIPHFPLLGGQRVGPGQGSDVVPAVSTGRISGIAGLIALGPAFGG